MRTSGFNQRPMSSTELLLLPGLTTTTEPRVGSIARLPKPPVVGVSLR
jgi:hypothetical protein